MSDPLVAVPRSVLLSALWKARSEYVRVAHAEGADAGPEDECWAEFEQLGEYVGRP